MLQETSENERKKPTFSIERLREILDYDSETGIFKWKIRPANQIQIGDVAGCLDESKGYVVLTIDGRHYYAHVVAWFYVYEVWTEVDHKNRIGCHNWIDNLRPSTRAQNIANQGVRIDNILGVKGVTRSGNKFVARIMVKGCRIYLGTFDTIEEATKIRQKAAVEHYGEFANS